MTKRSNTGESAASGRAPVRKSPETEGRSATPPKTQNLKHYKVSLSVLCPDGSTIRYEQDEGDRRLASDCWEAFLAFERRGG